MHKDLFRNLKKNYPLQTLGKGVLKQKNLSQILKYTVRSVSFNTVFLNNRD